MKKQLSVLQVEDSEGDASLIARSLEKAGYEIHSTRVETMAEMRAELDRRMWDVIIADYRLPQFDAPAALSTLHATGLEIPFIVVSGAMGEDLAVQMMKSGAHDYVMKSNLARLAPAVEREIKEAQIRKESRRGEAALRDSERQFRELAESIPQLVWSAGSDGEMIYCNSRYREQLGPGREPSVRPELLHPGDLQPSLRAWDESVRTASEYRRECRYRMAGGEYRWFLVVSIPVCDDQGRVLRWFGTSTDIDTQKRFADHIARSLQEKETLLREIHHRVKNNLQIISSLLSMQENGVGNQQAKAALQEGQRRVRSMALIHERLYGSQQMDRIDFSEYTRTLVNELSSSYTQGGNAVPVVFQTSSVLLNIDQAIPCGLILNELVTNCLKYAYPNGESGEILVHLDETSSGRVRLTVSDNGVGLPEGFNLKNAKSMGLPIVKLLANQIGGRLIVHSRPGASFTVDFQKEIKEATNVVGA